MPQPRSMPPLLEQLVASPLLIDDSMIALVQASVAHVVSHERAQEMMAAASNDDDDFWPTTDDDWRSYYRPYNVKDGTLQIPVMGVLLHRFPYQLGRWATGYKYIEMAVKRGLADANVQRIAFVIDSPGGEVAGCFELGDFIYENRAAKPMRSFSADHCYSAAFALGSATGKGSMSITRSGGIGSVGVITMHVEYSEALKQAGVKVTYIYRGKHKKDGNSYEPLPEAVRARIEKRIEKLYSVFTETVARNRGMEEQAVRDTEALTYDAEDGIEVGFADRLGALEDEMALFAEDTSAGDEQMADPKTYSQADIDAAVAAAATTAKAEGKAEGIAEGTASATAAAQARTDTVLGSEAGQKRPKASVRLLKTGMSAEDIIGLLGDLPEEQAAAPAPAAPKLDANGKPIKEKAERNHFKEAMSTDNPEIDGETAEDNDEQDTTASNVSSILGAYGSQAGIKKRA